MTRPFRFLGAANSSAAASIQPQTASTQPQAASVDSDFVVILAALLCALICVLGLIAVARCAWLRRVSSTNPQPPQPPSAANKGLKKKILRSLPKQSFSSELETKVSECAICLSEFAAGEEIRILPQCGHGFHVSCIDTWLGSHSSCPSCRQILVVTRCQKCGGLPPTSNRVGVVAESSSSEACSKERGDNGNNFLP